MHTIHEILALAERYAGARRISRWTLSRQSTGSSTWLERCAQGRVTFESASRFVRWLSTHWPLGLEWPPGVERPECAHDARSGEQRATREWASGLFAWEDKPGSGAQLAHIAQNLEDPTGQGHAMREPDLHPRAGNHPSGGVEVELGPLCPSSLAGADYRERHKLGQEPERRTRIRTAHGDDDLRQFAVWNRRVVPLLMLTRTPLRQLAVNGGTRGVVSSIAPGDGPFQNRADALAHTSSRLPTRVPNGSQDVEDVMNLNLGHRELTERGDA